MASTLETVLWPRIKQDERGGWLAADERINQLVRNSVDIKTPSRSPSYQGYLPLITIPLSFPLPSPVPWNRQNEKTDGILSAVTMAPGNLTISDSSSRRGLSCYLDVGRHDTRIDNITSISDVEGSEPRCCTRVIRTKRIFFRLEKDSYRKDFSATSDNRVTPLQIYLWFGGRRRWFPPWKIEQVDMYVCRSKHILPLDRYF